MKGHNVEFFNQRDEGYGFVSLAFQKRRTSLAIYFSCDGIDGNVGIRNGRNSSSFKLRIICIKQGFGLHALLINEEWVSVVFFECNKQFYLKSLKSHVLQILIHL